MSALRINSNTSQPAANCTMVALGIAALVSAVVISLGAFKLFGPLASPGFLGSVAGGGTLCLIFIGTLTLIAIHNCKSHNARSAQIKHDLGQEAIEFARRKLAEQPEIYPAQITGENITIVQPANQEIARLYTLYQRTSQAFEAVINQQTADWLAWRPGTPLRDYTAEEQANEIARIWSHPEVLQTADTLLKIGYALSILTLEDLPSFIQSKLAGGGEASTTEILTNPQFYPNWTLFSCTTAYHNMRAGAVWNAPCPGLCNPHENPLEDRFYQEGTIQFEWRMLYNAFCDLVRSQIDESDSHFPIKMLLAWTRKDEENAFQERTFERNPCPD